MSQVRIIRKHNYIETTTNLWDDDFTDLRVDKLLEAGYTEIFHENDWLCIRKFKELVNNTKPQTVFDKLYEEKQRLKRKKGVKKKV